LVEQAVQNGRGDDGTPKIEIESHKISGTNYNRRKIGVADISSRAPWSETSLKRIADTGHPFSLGKLCCDW